MAHAEDRMHLFVRCSAAARIWRFIGLKLSVSPFEQIWQTAPPPGLDGKLTPFVLLVVLQKIWDARNEKVFRQQYYSTPHVIQNIIDDLTSSGDPAPES